MPPYAQLTGTAAIHPDEAGFADRIAKAYGRTQGWDLPPTDYVTVHVDVTRVTGYGPVSGKPMSGWGA